MSFFEKHFFSLVCFLVRQIIHNFHWLLQYASRNATNGDSLKYMDTDLFSRDNCYPRKITHLKTLLDSTISSVTIFIDCDIRFSSKNLAYQTI